MDKQIPTWCTAQEMIYIQYAVTNHNGKECDKECIYVSIYSQSVSSVAQSCPALCNPMEAACQASLSITNSWSPHKPMSIESVTPSNHLIPFSSCPQSFPALGSFQMSQLFTSCGQNIGVSASTSVLPLNTQDLSPLGWTGWISLQSKGLLKVFSNTTVQKHQFFGTQNCHILGMGM